MQSVSHESLNKTLDFYKQQLEASGQGQTVRQFIEEMATIHTYLSEGEWRQLASTIVRDHSLSQLLRQDPYTKCAFDKPRDYAGDAVMLDFMYDGWSDAYEHACPVTPLGKVIFKKTVGSPSGQAVRNRKQILADYVDTVAEKIAKPTIMAALPPSEVDQVITFRDATNRAIYLTISKRD